MVITTYKPSKSNSSREVLLEELTASMPKVGHIKCICLVPLSMAIVAVAVKKYTKTNEKIIDYTDYIVNQTSQMSRQMITPKVCSIRKYE